MIILLSLLDLVFTHMDLLIFWSHDGRTRLLGSVDPRYHTDRDVHKQGTQVMPRSSVVIIIVTR